MPHSYVNCLMHCVFSTRERRPWLCADVRGRLFPYKWLQDTFPNLQGFG